MDAFSNLVHLKEVTGSLRVMLERFKPRLVDIATADVDVAVQLAAVKSLGGLMRFVPGGNVTN